MDVKANNVMPCSYQYTRHAISHGPKACEANLKTRSRIHDMQPFGWASCLGRGEVEQVTASNRQPTERASAQTTV